ncbi:PREDICTED: ankyrin repeat and SOCS box protein 16 [Corvus brachyrhynchos]|uniref:ankyrin repeat and SOCS box protein 16 n=1 Tax=Corvus brachyrhynchos TaxID=85066 RepID=UPI00081642AA|nr:PREDICTED: ankyrin repeat and SOCS box protein 16 [Corvus brachyrhynchos]
MAHETFAFSSQFLDNFAIYAGDLPRVQSIFRDEATANLVLEMVSEELVWSPEQGTGPGVCTAPRSLRCAELLLAHGAQVNLGTRDRQVTALHVAARQGLVAHVELYLHHQASAAAAGPMAGQPRRLQHLARVAIRHHLGARCHTAVPRLALPPPLRCYLQLPIEGLIS